MGIHRLIAPNFRDGRFPFNDSLENDPGSLLASIGHPGCYLEAIMIKKHRILICALILLLDLAVFFLPISAIFLVYIILQNPPWFRDFLKQLDHPHQS